MEKTEQSWINLMRWRSECHQRFGGIPDIRVVSSPVAELDALLRPGQKVLDVGAGAHKPWRQIVTRVTDEYYALDTDPEGDFDYQSFENIPADLKFDLVVANQVVEHLTLEQAFRMVRSAFACIGNPGHLFATVPNAAHPVRQRDCTHLTAWPVNDLYSLLRSAGFEVISVARYNKFPLSGDPVTRWLVRTMCREFRMDWCDSILVVGAKTSDGSQGAG